MTEFQKGFFTATATIFLLAMLFLFGPLAHCQSLMPIPEQQFFTITGAPNSNGFVYTYQSGTYTLQPTYTDYSGVTQNTNPVQLNAGGFPTCSGVQCGIWLASGSSYRIVVQNSSHITQYQIDGVTSFGPPFGSVPVATVTSTVQAAITLANPSGAGGIVYVPAGTWVGPTTIPDNTSLICLSGPTPSGAFGAFDVGAGTAANQCYFTYSAQLTISIHNVRIQGITFNFGNTATGLNLVSSSFNIFDNFWVTGCGGTACLSISTSGTTGTQNSIRNEFNGGGIVTAVAIAPEVGVLLLGSIANSTGVTLNTWNNFTIAGYIGCGVQIEQNSDTNYFYGLTINQDHTPAPTNSAPLCFNLDTPGSDQDSDGNYFDGLNVTGYPTYFTSFVRSGQSAGNKIITSSNQQGMCWGPACSPGLIFINLSSSTPTFDLATIQLSGGWAETMSGRLSALASGQVPASGSTAGDITAAESATVGKLFLGTGGQSLSSGSGAPTGNCIDGSIYINGTAASTSTVLYVCEPANTWTAITVP